MSKIETNVVRPEIKFFENEIEQIILTNETESVLEGRIKEIEDFMKNKVGKGKEQSEKDSIYGEAQCLWRDYSLDLKSAKYNFHLNRPQHKFLTNLILQKLEYDTNTVFFAIELTDMLGSMKDVKYSNDMDVKAFPVNATEITYIYHLISKHTIKGLTNDAYIFAQILRRIGNISKVLNYYDATAKSLATEIQDWVASFEDGVTLENTADAKTLKPKKEKAE